jgi:hypothetical protein
MKIALRNNDFLYGLVSIFAIAIIPLAIANSNVVFWGRAMLIDAGEWVFFFILVATVFHFLNSKIKHGLLAFSLFLYLIGGIGFSASFSMGFFAISAYLSGRIFLFVFLKNERSQLLFVESISIGLACLLCVFGICLHSHINYFWVYFLVLSVPLLLAATLNFQQLYRPQCEFACSETRDLIRKIEYGKYTAALIIIGFVARYCFFPSVGYDDNALHLGMWTALENNQRVIFDVQSQVWSTAPFAVDLCNAIVSILAQGNAHGALNFLFFILILSGVWRLTRLVNRKLDERLLILVLFVSTPMLAYLLTTLQTELFLAVLAVAGAEVALKKSSQLSGSGGAALILISALCCATKLPGAVLGGALLLAGLLQLKRRKEKFENVSIMGLTLLLLVGTFIAFHSYFYAWRLTGNPLFPLYNALFKSPFFDATRNFSDARFITGTNLKSYWELFFNSDKHLESKNYVAGFQYLILFPLSFVALLNFRRRQSAVKIMLPVLIFFGAMFASVQYLRYLFPILPLASVLIGALFAHANGWASSTLRGVIVKICLLAMVLLNLFFLPGISWYFDTPAGSLYDGAARSKLVNNIVPEQVFDSYLNDIAPNSKVLYEKERPFGSTLAASPVYINWYAPKSEGRANNVSNAEELAQFLKDENIDFVYWNSSAPIDPKNDFRVLLHDHLNDFGVPERVLANLIMYRLKSRKISYTEIVEIKDFKKYADKLDSKQIDDDGVLTTSGVPFVLDGFDTGKAQAAKYHSQLSCPNLQASFIAQINWNVGVAYYRLVPCNRDTIEFTETVPVPAGATTGEIYLTSINGFVKIKSLSVGLD